MLDQLDDVYREVLLDHYRRPRHWGRLDRPTRRAQGGGGQCGDRIGVEVKLVGGRIADIAVSGRACAVSTASASLMGEAVRGRSVEDVKRMIGAVTAMMETGSAPPEFDLGALDILRAVRKFPARIECVLLGWEVLRQALEENGSSPEAIQ